MRFLDMTKERWSVRKFSPEQISDEHMARILEAFGIPATWKIVAMMPMGYPAETAKPSSWHFRRKSLEELCQVL